MHASAHAETQPRLSTRGRLTLWSDAAWSRAPRPEHSVDGHALREHAAWTSTP